LVDADHVIFDWETAFVTAMRKRHPHIKMFDVGTRTLADKPYIDSIYNTPEVQDVLSMEGLYYHMPLIDGVKDALEEMAVEHEVFICTAPASRNKTCASEKLNAIEDHLGLEWRDNTIITKRKWLINGDVLIDDKLDIDGSERASWSHIVFDRSFNRDGSDKPRIVDWKWRNVVEMVLKEREGHD